MPPSDWWMMIPPNPPSCGASHSFSPWLRSACPSRAQAATRVSAFYYPWYATSAHDGGYQHWSQRGHAPPNDIASAFYPARGLYSSADRLVIGAQMDELHVAGVDEVAVSWWGRGSPEDARLPAVLAAAHAAGLAVAAHLEPYPGRTVAGTVDDVRYLHGLGIRTFYVYRALELPSPTGSAANTTLHAEGVTLIAQTALVGAAAAAGFDGVYTYDIVMYGGDKFMRLCAQAHKMHLLCAPSVGPGYDARRGSGDPKVKLRQERRHLRPHVARGDRRAAPTGSRSPRTTSGTRARRSSPRPDHAVAAATATSPTTGRGACTAAPPSTPTSCARATGRMSSAAPSPAQPNTRPS